jgi:hypothetical protein
MEERMMPVKNAAYIAALEKLVMEASPWIETRMNKHFRQSKSEKKPYYRDRHKDESDKCESWLTTAASLGLDSTSCPKV